MALKVWLPLNGDLHNQGCSDVIATGNNLTSNATGKIGSCYNFNGSSSYINLNAALLNSSTKEFSYCCWVKFNVLNKNQCLFSNRTKIGQTGFSIIYITPNKFYFDAGSRLTITVPITLVTGQWYHFAFTFKNSNSTIDKRAYINGEEMINAGGQAPDALANATQSFIGASQNSSTTVSDNYLNGSLNDVRIYNHCLSAAEVREISYGLVLHYKLDDINNYISNENLMPNSDTMALGSANPTTGTWRNAGTSNMTRTRVLIENNIYGFQNSGIQTANDGSCYGIDNFPLKGNTLYCISMKARKIDGTGDAFAGFNIYAISQEVAGSHTKIDKNYRVTPLTNEWTECWYIIKTNANAKRNIYIGITTGNTSVTTQMCQVKIQEVYQFDNNNIIQDSSGYNYNGTVLGNPIISLDTIRYTSSTSFPVNADGILSTYPLTLWNNAFTYSFWIKPSGENGGRSIYAASYSGTSCSIEKTSGNKLRFYWNGSPDLSTSSLTITDGTWQHIAIVKEENKTTVKCYYNGALKDTFTNTFSNKTFSGNLRIARDTRGDATSYTGMMSDFRIYCTALDADAIRQLYEVGAKVDNKQNLHAFELVENNSKIQINKQGQTLCNELEEDTATKFYKVDEIIETNEFIEF